MGFPGKFFREWMEDAKRAEDDALPARLRARNKRRARRQARRNKRNR